MTNNIFYNTSFRDPQNFSKAGNYIGIAGEDFANQVDLNQQLVKNKLATFFMRVNCESMAGAGIYDGDVVIVDRSIEAGNGKVIIAVVNGEMIIRQFEINNGKRRLLPATDKLSPIEIVENSEFSIWGVVTYVIHSV